MFYVHLILLIFFLLTYQTSSYFMTDFDWSVNHMQRLISPCLQNLSIITLISFVCEETGCRMAGPPPWMHACSALTLNEVHVQLHTPAPLPQGGKTRVLLTAEAGCAPVASFDIVPPCIKLWNPQLHVNTDWDVLTTATYPYDPQCLLRRNFSSAKKCNRDTKVERFTETRVLWSLRRMSHFNLIVSTGVYEKKEGNLDRTGRKVLQTSSEQIRIQDICPKRKTLFLALTLSKK